MSFRITTNGLFRSYRSNLQQNTKNLRDSMERVQTQRNFTSYAEDPAAANRAFQLRRMHWRAADQIENTDYVITKFSTAFSSLESIVDGEGGEPGLSGIDVALRAITDTTASGRRALGKQMITTAESIVKLANSRYGDEFVFAGADGLNVPMEWVGGNLYYRGVDVNAPKPMTEAEFNSLGGDYSSQKLFQDYLKEKEIDPASADFDTYKTYLKDVYHADYDDIAVRFDEGTYVDIGIGFQLDDNGQVIPTSAYNSALSALDYLGYGEDEDGDPKNVAVLIHRLGEIFSRCDEDTGTYATRKDEQDAQILTDKLHSAINAASEMHVKLSAEVQYLKTNREQLEESKYNFNVQIEEVEKAEPAMAITAMNWAQYCYNAALRIGNNLLSQSLLDYMN